MPDTSTIAPPELVRVDESPRGEVVRVEYAHGGYVWIAYASHLPARADGGSPDTHRLVTLLTRKGSAAYVLADDGPLHPAYLREKFGHVVPEHNEPGAWAAIGHALGREVTS